MAAGVIVGEELPLESPYKTLLRSIVAREFEFYGRPLSDIIDVCYFDTCHSRYYNGKIKMIKKISIEAITYEAE